MRTALIPFACVNKNGLSVLVEEPSIVCSLANADYRRMHSVAVALLLCFGMGLPLLFVGVLWRYRFEMFYDQLLRVRNEGESALTNPHISIRRRFRKLYEDYKVSDAVVLSPSWTVPGTWTVVSTSRTAQQTW